jgi:hypothetical protein
MDPANDFPPGATLNRPPRRRPPPDATGKDPRVHVHAGLLPPTLRSLLPHHRDLGLRSWSLRKTRPRMYPRAFRLLLNNLAT